jgi:hypothetical protein
MRALPIATAGATSAIFRSLKATSFGFPLTGSSSAGFPIPASSGLPSYSSGFEVLASVEVKVCVPPA